MRVASLHTYPVKGGYRLDHDGAEVALDGLAGDRSWLVVDPDGALVAQPDVARLGQIRAIPAGDGLVLRAAGMPELTVTGAGAEADDWLSTALDRKVQLVQRPIWKNPVLVTTIASLDALNDRMLEAGSVVEPVAMSRFRPNIVLDGTEAWAEEGWIGRRVRIGPLVFRVTESCERCVITTYDQETGERGREPLRFLARQRNMLFGVYLTPEATGRLAVGDIAEVLHHS